MARRIRWLGIGMVLCFFLLFLQLNNIQVVKAHQYATAAGNPVVQRALYDKPRGVIQSADGKILAQSVRAPKSSIYQYKRVYPEQWATLFSGVVGVDSINLGNYGVEESYNQYLVAHSRPVTSIKDLLTTSPPITDTVTLTISSRLQQDARNALAGRAGAVVAINPSTGAILALYANPTFDPNPLASLSGATENKAFKADTTNFLGYTPFTSLAYQDATRFGPGSTFKTVTTAAAYDRAPQLVNTPVPSFGPIPSGHFQGQTQPLANDAGGQCGGTIAIMLPESCDTGYAILGTEIGAPSMTAEADGFGFNQQPPIDLPHNSRTQISDFLQPNCYQNAQVFLAYSSIGQKCTTASPLQMAMVASAFADNGTLMTPHVMAQIRDSDGNLVTQYKPTAWKQATSAATAA